MKTEYINLLVKLNELGITIVEIDERVYYTAEFNPAQDLTVFHSMVGKDVTDYFALHFNNVDLVFLQQKIEQYPQQTKQFHKDYKYTIHLPKHAR